jgi:hypothetical protein
VHIHTYINIRTHACTYTQKEATTSDISNTSHTAILIQKLAKLAAIDGDEVVSVTTKKSSQVGMYTD